MGLLHRLSTIASPSRVRAQTGSQAYRDAFWKGEYLPEPWISSLSASGVHVTPELALTLSAMYSGVTIIGIDLATIPCHVFKSREDGGKDRVRPFYGAGIDSSNGVRSLAYMLDTQPNAFQSAPEFMFGQVAQFLLRGVAYAEIKSSPTTGFLEALLPRHPDRVRPERLPNGRLRFRLSESTGEPRYLTQDEMFVVRDLSLDGGLTSLSRVQYGAQAIGSALATQAAAGRFFKSGMTASTLATYSGQQDPEWEDSLHKSISRYAAGIDNAFGLLLVPDDVKISNLGVEPDKAQMMLSQEWGVREVARLLRLSQRKLGVEGPSQSGSAHEEENAQHVTNCLRPIAVLFEKAIKRDLILAKDAYFAEYLLDAFIRGNSAARAAYYQAAIEAPWMWPSEVRMKENMNPDPDLDELAKVRYRPGTPRESPDGMGEPDEEPVAAKPPAESASARAELKAYLGTVASAVTCVRRERAAVEKLAKKHASDVAGWQAGLRDFYADHAHFVAEAMAMPIVLAREYAAQHGEAFEASGVVLIDGSAGTDWERQESAELATLALYGRQAA